MTPRELANAICETLRSRGYEALLAGGCVRDILLGREPADYDVATDATPDEVMALFPESLAVGAQFGVIAVRRDGLKVEVATFRADAGYSDGRHPDNVVYARTAQEDVQRRDFTINGLLMRHDTGEVLDYIDGDQTITVPSTADNRPSSRPDGARIILSATSNTGAALTRAPWRQHRGRVCGCRAQESARAFRPVSQDRCLP